MKMIIVKIIPTTLLGIIVMMMFAAVVVVHGESEIISPTMGGDLTIEDWGEIEMFPQDTIVGKTVTFEIVGQNDVWLYPTMSCDDSEGGIFVGPTTPGDTTASYTFETDDGSQVGNNVLFVNQASGDPCANENQIQIRVFSTQADFEVVQSGLADGGSGLGPDTNGNITADDATPPTTNGGTSGGLSIFGWKHETLVFLAMFMIGTTFLGL
jgi:hypothetical protein